MVDLLDIGVVKNRERPKGVIAKGVARFEGFCYDHEESLRKPPWQHDRLDPCTAALTGATFAPPSFTPSERTIPKHFNMLSMFLFVPRRLSETPFCDLFSVSPWVPGPWEKHGPHTAALTWATTPGFTPPERKFRNTLRCYIFWGPEQFFVL